MASANTIREFLIGLGVEIDAAGVNRFVSTVKSLTAEAERFAFRVAAMATAFNAALIKTADLLENLYYTAQRANTTADNLRGLQFAAAQIGLSAEDARSALESLAMAMRINPGNESLLRALGIQTRDLRGNMRDTSDIMDDFLDRLSKMPFYLAVQYAQLEGMNARTLFMLLKNREARKEALAEWRTLARQLGVDLDAYSEQAKDFMNSLRGTGEIIELLWMRLASVLMARYQPQIEKFNKFLLSHAEQIENFALSLTGSVMHTIEDIESLLPMIDILVTKTLGWQHALEIIAGIIVYRIFGPLGLALYAFEKLKDLGSALAEQRSKDPNYRDLPQQDHLRSLDELKKLPDEIARSVRRGFEWLFGSEAPRAQPQSGEGFDPRMLHPAAYQIPLPNEQPESARLQPSGRAPIAVRQNNPGNLRYAPSQSGSAGGFAVFRSAQEGFLALRHQLLLYAQRGLDSVASIISKYAPPSENNTAAYISNLARSMHVDPRAHLDFKNPEVLRGIMEGIARIESGYSPWSSELIDRVARVPLGAGARAGAGAGVTIHQHNQFDIRGAEPRETARAVTREQELVGASLVRTFRGAIIA